MTSEDVLKERIEVIDRAWGTGEYSLGRLLPGMSRDDEVRRFMARWERLSASPSATITVLRMGAEIDARHILPTIHVPTLVLHRAEDTLLPVQCGRDLARTIPGAEYVELPGNNHVPLFEPDIVDRIVGEVEEFLTGSRSETEIDRVLATVMFTDIVESTKRAAELGDRQWRALLDRHDETVRQQLVRFRGQEVKNLGDGFLATFDGPARAVRCASAIAETVRPLGIAVRSGLHTGEIELKPHDIAGIAVHIRGAHAACPTGRVARRAPPESGLQTRPFPCPTLPPNNFAEKSESLLIDARGGFPPVTLQPAARGHPWAPWQAQRAHNAPHVTPNVFSRPAEMVRRAQPPLNRPWSCVTARSPHYVLHPH